MSNFPLSLYHVRLANKLARDPNFRNRPSWRVVVTEADVRAVAKLIGLKRMTGRVRRQLVQLCREDAGCNSHCVCV